MENLFEVALRNKVRFNFKGMITVEDLFSLSVEDLDTIFKGLNAKLKEVKEESLLGTKSQENKILDTKIEIVKYIVKTKLDESKVAQEERELKVRRQKILEVIASKEDEGLKGKSLEELKAML